MIWCVGVTTAPRRCPTLERSLESLARSGFARGTIFSEPQAGAASPEVSGWRVVEQAGHGGAWRTWLVAVAGLLDSHPEAEALLVCQDDAVFCRGLRHYLERSLWPADGVAVCSPYCPSPYRSPRPGWHRQDRGWSLVGAVCWAIPRTAAEAICRELGRVEAAEHIDSRIGRWALRTDRSVWYHTPSLVQHVAPTNSALGHNHGGSLRQAADFVGEEYLLPATGVPPSP